MLVKYSTAFKYLLFFIMWVCNLGSEVFGNCGFPDLGADKQTHVLKKHDA